MSSEESTAVEPGEQGDMTALVEAQSDALVGLLQDADYQGACDIMVSILRQSNHDMFNNLGHLTRGLHNALVNFHVDSDLDKETESELEQITDASDRLNYVIAQTQQAADKTIDAVENSQPLAAGLMANVAEIQEKWQRLGKREMSAEEFRAFYDEMNSKLDEAHQASESLSGNLHEILLTQGFQDLTGQVMHRVINMVQGVERDLVELVKVAGQVEMLAGLERSSLESADDRQERLMAGEGPQVKAAEEDGEESVSSQDEVDDLLSSLGF